MDTKGVSREEPFLIRTQDPYGLLVVLMEEVQPEFEPGPAASRAGLASQGYHRNPETHILVPREPSTP